MTTKNLEAFLNAIQTAKAPERFTNKFLTDLEFKSTNDRLFIGVLKGLGFLDESGVPTERYFSFLDQGHSATVLADSIRHAYGDLFAVNTNANQLSEEQVKGKFKTLTQGQKSENVLALMAKTFVALCSLADFSAKTATQSAPVIETAESPPANSIEIPIQAHPSGTQSKLQLHYNIQLILPDARDPKVYDQGKLVFEDA